MFPEINVLLLCLFAIAFIAAFIKGITGTGLGTIIVSFSTLVLDVKQAVVLASLLSLYSGVAMIKSGPVSIKSKYYIFILTSLLAGTVSGAMLLKYSPDLLVKIVMLIILSMAGTLFTFNIAQKPTSTLLKAVPESPSFMDIVIGFVAGILTGLVGISIPILVLYFGRNLSKEIFRHFIVLLFVPSAFFQVLTFHYNGLLNITTWGSSVLMVPFLVLGLLVGNKVFHLISEKQFRKYLGVFLYVIAAKLALT